MWIRSHHTKEPNQNGLKPFLVKLFLLEIERAVMSGLSSKWDCICLCGLNEIQAGLIKGSLGANAQQGSSLQVKKMKSFGFCSIVHTSLMLEQGLFVPKLGDELHNVVVLKVPPDGKSWHVELLQSGCRIVFHNGWQEFVEHYSIATGHFLVFRYNGNSDFRISIFDMTACEISYSCYLDYLEKSNSGKETKEARPGMLDTDGDNSLEELADKPSGERHSYTKTTVARRSTGEA
ncbi:hypothetical protein IFM89_038061 [Coptis chinensis]|uniref:TF-B3 domain-containing protein n=1 Tax=Coptis chinensis TaxID=261450 RepID=A0A835H373_9MAGN|nr:hypothetical protein IFM89_038061 [Coptis chinensis]